MQTASVVGRINTSVNGQDSVNYKIYTGSAPLDTTTPSAWTNSVNFTADTTFNQIEFINGLQVDEIRFAADWQAVTGQAPLPFQAPAPLISPAPGSYDPSVQVSIHAPAGAVIRYSTDGSIPSIATGTVYVGPFTLTQSATVKAITTQAGLQPSTLSSAVFTLPVMNPYTNWLVLNGLPASTPPAEDSDNDGLNNLLEYALGGIPASMASAPFPQQGFSGQYLTISFLRARSDITYIVVGSTDLITWTAVPYTPVAEGQIQTVTDTIAITTSVQRYLRLKVMQP